MHKNNLSLADVIRDYTSDEKVVTDRSTKNSLLLQFNQYKVTADQKLSELLTDKVMPGQVALQEKFRRLHREALQDFALRGGIINGLFPRLDISFLTHIATPKWALFNAAFAPDTFSIDFGFKLWECNDFRTHICIGVKTSEPSLSVTPEHFRIRIPDFHLTLRQDSFESMIAAALQSKKISERFTPSSDWLKKNPHFRVEPGRKGAFLHIVYQATFDSIVPDTSRIAISTFADLFDELFFIADIPDWQPSHVWLETVQAVPASTSAIQSVSLAPRVDPLLVGRIGNTYRLLDAFDVTDTEEYVRREFTF